MNRWADGWRDGQADGQMGGQTAVKAGSEWESREEKDRSTNSEGLASLEGSAAPPPLL